MIAVGGWYLALLLLGAAGLLPAAALFGSLDSRGVAYARPLALALIALSTWLLSALTGAAYGDGLVALLTAALIGASAALAWRRPELVVAVRSRWRRLLAAEVAFAVLFLLGTLVRAQAPDASGTEKPMDLMLITAVHRTETLPPADSWFAGAELSYHHLGHVTVDIVGRLGGTDPGVSFTLAVPLALALATVAVGALAADIGALTPRRWRRWRSCWRRTGSARPMRGGRSVSPGSRTGPVPTGWCRRATGGGGAPAACCQG